VGVTEDRNDPALWHIGPDGMQAAYLVLSESERAKGFVRPVLTSYWHTTCGTVTTMGIAIAETYARDPHFYGGTYCARCRDHFPVGPDGEFYWCDPSSLETQNPASQQKVGT
jgi:hypothetical protein